MGRILLISLLFYFIIRFIRRLIFPVQNKTRNNNQRQAKPGKITIENIPDNSKIFNKNEGDYVDYKEVK